MTLIKAQQKLEKLQEDIDNQIGKKQAAERNLRELFEKQELLTKWMNSQSQLSEVEKQLDDIFK